MKKQTTDMPKELVKKAAKVEKESKKAAKKGQDKKIFLKTYPTLKIINQKDIALDFAAKVYQKFDKMIKSVVLFGSSARNTSTSLSDIDIIIIIDDATVAWDQELIAWYREELGKLIRTNPYNKELHINTIKLTTWWHDLIIGDPVVINVIRYGEALIDFGGYFEPLKVLLQQGKIKPSPEAIYSALQRAPLHLARSKSNELSAIEGVYWAMVDSAHAALIAAKQMPPSPEHVPIILKETFVDKNKLDMKYVLWYRDLFAIHKRISHGEIVDLRGVEIDEWQDKAGKFIEVMASLIKNII